jgi:hypothetical protein
LFVPLLKLARSDMKDRTLGGMLEMLNACGHLISNGWPLILAAVQEACEIGDAKTQVLAFKYLRLIVDDLIPSSYLPDCIKCIGRFAKDVNISVKAVNSLTAVNELWSVADVIKKQKAWQESDPSKRKLHVADVLELVLLGLHVERYQHRHDGAGEFLLVVFFPGQHWVLVRLRRTLPLITQTQ